MRGLRRFMKTRGVPAPLQLAALCVLTCVVLFVAMWGCSYIGIPGLAGIFNVLLLLAVFVSIFFLILTLIVVTIELARKLVDLYASRQGPPAP